MTFSMILVVLVLAGVSIAAAFWTDEVRNNTGRPAWRVFYETARRGRGRVTPSKLRLPRWARGLGLAAMLILVGTVSVVLGGWLLSANPFPSPGADAVGDGDAGSSVAGDPTPLSNARDIGSDELVFDSSYVAGVAAAVSREVFPEGHAANVILARDVPSGDALAAGSLVGLFDTTVLLTDSESLSPITADEIDRLGRPRVHILGGPDAVSQDIEEQLRDAGHDIHRHAGPRQGDTAVDIAGAHFPDARTAVLVRTPDLASGPLVTASSALAATSFAASQDLPILLSDTDQLSDATESYLRDASIEEMIVVGEDDEFSTAVTSTLSELGIEWVRWGGADRFATAVQVAQHRGFGLLESANVVVLVEGAHDSVWPAGFLGAVRGAHEGGPVVLTQGDELPAVTAQYLSTATPDVDVVCTPGVTRRACATALDIVDDSGSR